MTWNRQAAFCLLPLLLLTAPSRGLPQPPERQVQPGSGGDRAPLPPGALARFGSTHYRHPGTVFFLGFTGEGRHLLAGSGDGDLFLWDVATAERLRRFPPPPREPLGGRGPATAVVHSRDGKTLARVWEGELQVTEAATGKALRRFEQARLVKDAKLEWFDTWLSTSALSADGRLLAVGDGMGGFGPRVGVWKVATGDFVGAVGLGDKERLREVALADDGVTLATLSEASTLSLWDVARGKRIRSFDLGPRGGAYHVQFLPGGMALVVLTWDAASAYLLDAGTGKELRRFPVKGPLRRLRLSADGKLLLGSGARGAQVWDTATGKEVRQFAAAESDPDWGAAALAPDGKTLAVGVNTFLRLFDLDTGKEKPAPAGHLEPVAALAFSPGGARLVTATYHSPALLWDVPGKRLLREFRLAPEMKEKKEKKDNPDIFGLRLDDKLKLLRVEFAPDGKTVASLVLGQPLRRWDAATGKPLPPWADAPPKVASFAFAPNGKSLALAGPGGVRLVQPATGKTLRTLHPDDGDDLDPRGRALTFGAATFTPDGRTLIASTLAADSMQLEIESYEAATGQKRLGMRATHELAPKEREGIVGPLTAWMDLLVLTQVVAPDGKHLATVSPTVIKLWDLRTGREARLFGGREVLPTTVLFSPDARWLLAGRHDGGIRVWEVATGTVLHDLPAHESAVTALAFSPDGRRLASGSADTTALLWDWAALRQQVLAARSGKTAELEPQWQALAGADARKAYAAVLALAAQPGPAVVFLKARLKPAGAGQAGDKADDPVPAGPLLQSLRAVEVLERIGTVEARQVLEALAGGAAGHRLTLEAAAAVRRLKP